MKSFIGPLALRDSNSDKSNNDILCSRTFHVTNWENNLMIDRRVLEYISFGFAGLVNQTRATSKLVIWKPSSNDQTHSH